MNNFQNKGMFLETIINYTINYYQKENIGLFYQRPNNIIPITTKFINNKKIITKGYFHSKSSTDFYGCFEGQYIEFEAKTTTNNKFFWKQVLKHQWIALEQVKKFNGISFIIIYFYKYNNFFMLFYDEIMTLKNKYPHSIKIELLEKYEIFINYPLIVNFINRLKNYHQHH